MLPYSSDPLMRGRLCSSLASSANSRRAKTPSVTFSSVGMGFHSEFSLQTTMTKKGKKRKLAETEAVKRGEGEKRRKDGSGGGCASYLHMRLEIGEGGREVDLSPEYLENHLIMALK